jgi:hypothetical protein
VTMMENKMWPGENHLPAATGSVGALLGPFAKASLTTDRSGR